MTPAAFGQTIVAALGIAISPVSIAAVILLLLSPRAKAASIGFLIGWTIGILVPVTGFALLSRDVPTHVPGSAHMSLAIIQLVVGALLLVLAAMQWRARDSRPDAPTPIPAWMRAVDRATPAVAVAVGLAMAVNPPNLLLSLAGGVAIGASHLVAWQIAPVIAVFLLVAASTVLVPVIVYLIAAERLQEPLEKCRVWLTRHSARILTAVFLGVGLLALGQGLTSL